MTGQISYLSPRGFGFVMPAGCDRRYDAHFFCRDDCEPGLFGRLAVGKAVEFESTVEARGLRAANVRLPAAAAIQ